MELAVAGAGLPGHPAPSHSKESLPGVHDVSLDVGALSTSWCVGRAMGQSGQAERIGPSAREDAAPRGWG